LVIYKNLPAVGFIDPRQELHQGTFAGTILAEDAMDLPSSECNRDVLVGANGSKRLIELLNADVHFTPL